MSDGPEQRATSGRRRRSGRGRARPETGQQRPDPQRRERQPGAEPRRGGGPDPRRDAARRERRAQARAAVVVPPITYPEELPVSARRADIAAAIRDHQVVVVSGETGSGKTTQLPKIMLELGRGRAGQIGHTQPRRIAARSVAERISEEITGGSGALGTVVGYQVRFTDQSAEDTLVKVMTDGILLAQIQRDPQLLAYDTLIIDEAHERSLNIDFLLGYLTRLLPQRPDLKVVITSATIDSDRFARHFGAPPSAEHPDGVPAPVIEVTGRTYPVEIRYRPLVPDPPADDDAPGPQPEERDLMTAICEAVDELSTEGPGDILVFLSGEREIRDAEEALRGHLGPRALGSGPPVPGSVELLPLYSRLSAAEQHRVFEPHGHRRVVLATNVAETSLTVPGVRYVVDPGTARISRYSKATKVQRLPIEPISQASANQRSGRCGRVADGVAIRLYSAADFAARPQFTEPEILRTSLASVILQMVAVGVAGSPDDVTGFPFVEPPDVRSVRDGVQLLTELGALSPGAAGTRLTEVGRALALLPMDPRLARMIVEAGRRDVAREVMVVAAALSIQDPRERPVEQRPQADQLHARFADPTSDFLTYLNLWHYVRDRQRELSGSAFRRMCRAEHLNYLRLREWADVVAQLKEMARPLGIVVRPPTRPAPLEPAGRDQQAAVDASLRERRTSRSPGGARSPEGAATGDGTTTGEEPEVLRLSWDADRIHQSLLAGLLSQIGMQEVTEVRVGGPAAKDRGGARTGRRPASRNEYLGARGARFAIFPGSPLSRKPPAWIMAGELVETSRLWARDVARISPEWAEELAPHLVRRTYSEPAWSTKQGAATAWETVLLYGVPIVSRRRVLFAKVDPEHARELFIRHALVQGEWTTHHQFFHDNRRVLAEAEQLEHRARRRGLVADDDALFAFYDERVPADVVSARHFDQWWKGARRTEPGLLSLSVDMLVTPDAVVDETQFPSTWPQGDLELPLTYQFDPGTEADGVTVHIPLPVLNRVRPEGFDWLVPGMQLELATATIRSLPKPVRVQLVPAPDVARDVVAWIAAELPSWPDTVRAADMADSWHEAFAAAVRALRGVEVPEDAWDDSRLPAHLRMTFRVHEERAGGGLMVDQSSDLVALQRRLAAQSEQAVSSAVRDAVRAAVRGAPGTTGATEAAPPVPRPGATSPAGTSPPPAPDLERTGLGSWPEGLDVLPDVVTATAGGVTVHGYPALVVGAAPAPPGRGPAARPVDLRVLTTADDQALRHGAGVRELLLADVGLATARVTSRWSTTESLALAASPYPSTDALVADLQRAAIDALVDAMPAELPRDLADVRDAVTYGRLRTRLRDTLEDRTYAVAREVATVLSRARELDVALRSATSLPLLSTVTDLRDQLTELVHDGFVADAGAARLGHLVRYLRAAQHRLTKAQDDPQRDQGLAWQLAEARAPYTDAVRVAAAGTVDAARQRRLAEVRWMLEELRVSLFAQQLGTAHPVSAKRIRTALES